MEYPARKTLDDKEMFDDIVRAILSVIGDYAVKIILYGSVARGDNTWESDVDIAVLTRGNYDRTANRRKLLSAITPLNLKHDTLISVTPIDEKRYSEWLFDLPFYFNIDEEGLTLWKKETGQICPDTALNGLKKNLTQQSSY
ncbi:MAG: nucleotidyltransferase domain-containing protein [Synergistaceae bacterium]|nr:nucleotidyltransferase domain-containing protein [Synergistaceae bacterium]